MLVKIFVGVGCGGGECCYVFGVVSCGCIGHGGLVLKGILEVNLMLGIVGVNI